MTIPEKYQTIFNTVNDIIIIQELIYNNDKVIDYRFLDINPAFEKIYQLSKDTVVDKLASEIFNIYPPPYLKKYTEVAKTLVPARFEAYIESIQKHFLYSVYPENDRRLISTATDITEYVHRNNEGNFLSNRLIPICANCKKVRNEENNWEQVEIYISRYTNARFSHGICPDCMQKLYPELSLNDDINEDKL